MKIIVAALILVCSCLPGMAQQVGTAWLGVASENVTQEEADKLGWKEPRGVRVANLTAGSPAESAGLQAGDILVSLDGTEIANGDTLTDVLLDKAPGTVIMFSVRRAGLEKQVSVTLGTRPIRRADTSPQLMLDTGGHMANVVDTAITPDGKQLVSASNDKTVRIWDIATGKTVRMIRGESAPGDWGTIYAMSLSRDGRWLAIAGFLSESDVLSGSAVHLYDFATGKLVKVIRGHRNVVFALAFSPDGKRLISGSGDKSAIIWDVATGKQLFRLMGHSEKIEAVAFNKDGTRAVTGSSDETMRLWNANDGKLIAEMTEHRSITQQQNKESKIWQGHVKTVAFSANDRLIASGSEDGRVLLWDGGTGAFLRQLAFPGGMVGGAAINSLSFSPDGKWLLFASAMEGCQFYEVDSGKEFWDGKLLDKPESRFFSNVKRADCSGGVAFSPGGQFAVASYNNMIHLLDPRTGKTSNTLQSSGTTVHTTGFAKDGRSIAWGTDLRGATEFPPLTYRLNLPTDGAALAGPDRIIPVPASSPRPPKPANDHPGLSTGLDAETSPTDDNYLRRSPKHGSFSVDFKHVDNVLINTTLVEISKDGKLQTKIQIDDEGRKHSALGFTPDGQVVLISRGNAIQSYDLGGRQLDSFTGHLATVRDHAPSADGRFLVSGGFDQTVRLWNLQTRELIVSLFYGTDGEWVVWTPQGYYASSPNGDRIVGWQINKGPDQAAEYVTASQLRSKFYRPDIVERAIVLASAAKAVEEVDPARADGFQLSDLAQRLPPKLAVISSRDRGATSNGRTTIHLALSETSGDPIKTFQAFVNDTKVTAEAKREGGTVSFEIPLAKGNNRIRLVARSKADLLGEAQFEVVQRGDGALDKRNTLFIVAIGADKYPQLPKKCGPKGNAACDLAFAGADAKAFAATIEKQMGGQHKRVVKRVLVNGAGGELEPTRANVENALDTLREAKDNDTVAVFIAGHGLNDSRSGYQFLPSDARFTDGSNLASSSVIKWAVLEDAIQSARGRRLLFVDTCRSTNAFNPRLMKDASDDAIVAFSATNSQQDALELADLGHGAFTSVVVKGLNGAADIAQEQEVRVFDLGAYVEREVRKLTKGLQTPDFYKKPGAENFVLARLSNATAGLPAADRQNTISELNAVSREEPPVRPTDPPVLHLPADKPTAATPPAPETKLAAVPSPASDVKPAASLSDPATKPSVALPPAPKVKPEIKSTATLPPVTEVKPAAVPPAAPVAKPAGLSISPSEEAERLRSAQVALALDDVGGARLIFEYLATHGSAAGAYQLAQTYDPQILVRTPIGAMFKPDAKVAEGWYLRAAELGHAEARKKLSVKK
jgi:WD40 repeat protein/uncharacterized caspase-like protein